MRSSIASRQNGVLTQLCAACRQRATRSLSTSTRTTVLASTTAATRASPWRSLPCSERRRWLSQTAATSRPSRSASSAAENSPSSTATSPSTSTAPDTTATSSVSGEPRPSPPSYYALFPQTLPSGPPPSGPFHIDVRALRREFLRLQAASHPDFHAHGSADPAARRQAEATSALINGAFRTLANPLLRAQYLLREQFGLDLAGDEAGSIVGVEEDVLDVVLEARETIEEAETEDELVTLREENEERIRMAEDAIGRAFGAGDIEALKREVVRLRYWVNIRESIDNWERGKPVVLEH